MSGKRLKGVHILSGMDDSSLDELLKYGEIVDFAVGDMIVRQHEKADAMYFILGGKLGAYFTGTGGGELHLRTMEHGSHFGEIGLLESGVRTANVKALEASTLFRLDAGSFKELLKDQKLAVSLLYGLSRSLSIRLADITTRLADERALKELLSRGPWI